MARGVELSQDTVVAGRLDADLGGLVDALTRGTSLEPWVDPRERERHAFFWRSVERGAEGHAALVLKSYPIGDDGYALTIVFLPPERPLESIPRIVDIEAHPDGASYRFRCPFPARSTRLATHTIGSVTFHCDGSFDRARAEQFVRFKADFEAAAGATSEPLDYYCFGTLEALLRTYGLVHDSSKCNDLARDLGFLADRGRRFVTGTGDERYLFGYVRGVLTHRAKDPAAVYAPYANGIAAYYGGYSLSGDSMETLAGQLRDELASRPSLDFLEEFQKGRKSSVQRHFTHYVLCAFLFAEVKRRHGTAIALEGLETGPGGESFFDFLEARLGVGPEDFHDLIADLIR